MRDKKFMLMVCKRSELRPRYIRTVPPTPEGGPPSGYAPDWSKEYALWWVVFARSAAHARLCIKAGLERSNSKKDQGIVAQGGYRKVKTTEQKAHARSLASARQAERDRLWLGRPMKDRAVVLNAALKGMARRKHVGTSDVLIIELAGSWCAWAQLDEAHTTEVIEQVLESHLVNRDLYLDVMYHNRINTDIDDYPWRGVGRTTSHL